jgi:hypothetical protein
MSHRPRPDIKGCNGKKNNEEIDNLIDRKLYHTGSLYNNHMRFLRHAIILLICTSIGIAVWLPLHGDIHYFSDNARDMLLLNEMATEKPITLIGPRSGIGGVFHGPLWLYMNFPAFLVGNGDPATMGWFWWGLYTLNIGIIYMVGRKLFDEKAGLISALLFSFAFISTGWSQFNANGILLISPLLAYFLVRYSEGGQLRDAGIMFFLTGLLIQFQIAFGLPILILLIGVMGFFIVRRGVWKHILAIMAVLPGISTHILFDIRHSFIQLSSLIKYIASSDKGQLGAPAQDRMFFALREFANWIPGYSVEVSIALLIGLCMAVMASRKARLTTLAYIYLYLYVGFWIITLGYSGTMWPYYYWGFVPILFLLIGGAVSNLKPPAHAWVAGTIVLLVTVSHTHWFLYTRVLVLSPRPISWKFHKEAVHELFESAPPEFGYYVFEDDLYGYGPKYTFVYWQKRTPAKIAYLNKKYETTYLYMMPTSSETLTWEGWIRHNVRIDTEPKSIKTFPNDVTVYRYHLSKQEQAVPSDPNLLDSLIFR